MASLQAHHRKYPPKMKFVNFRARTLLPIQFEDLLSKEQTREEPDDYFRLHLYANYQLKNR